MTESRHLHISDIINFELSDQEEILHKRCTFIGQVNNVLCYFPTLAADVRYKLFSSYCISIFGCELWNINTFCTTWRTGLRRIWNLPSTTHCDLLHLLSDDLPIFDELCRRCSMFIYKCFFHSSSLVKFVTRYAIMFVRYKSTLGSINNFLLCVSRFGFSKSAFLNGSINMNKFFFRITIFCRVRT